MKLMAMIYLVAAYWNEQWLKQRGIEQCYSSGEKSVHMIENAERVSRNCLA